MNKLPSRVFEAQIELLARMYLREAFHQVFQAKTPTEANLHELLLDGLQRCLEKVQNPISQTEVLKILGQMR